MNGSRSSPPRRGDKSSLDALSRTIEGLEARIEDLMGAPPAGRDPRRPAERERGREREHEREDRRSSRTGATAQSALEEIRQRQRALDAGHQPPRHERPAPRSERYEERPPVQRQRDYRLETPEPRARAPHAMASPRDMGPRDMGMQDIAQALVSLRHELKQDISEGVSREVSGLLNELRSLKSMAGDRRHAEDMRGDLARLADGIGQLGRQVRPDDAETLRAEFEDLRSLMDNLAREDSVRRMESRWDGVEQRLQSFNTDALQDELVSLAYRLDDIKSQLGSMRDVPAIRALEDRMMSIASTLDDLGKRIEPRNEVVTEQFAGLDRRLDEISRAIAASTRNPTPALDPVFLQRLENRIGALAEQIEDIGAAANRPDPTAALNARFEALANRIEDLAGERTASHLEERLDALSTLLASNQKQAQAPELTRALSDISRKIDSLDHGLVNDVLAERLDYLARRIDAMETQPQPVPVFDDSALRRLENQIGGIAARLNETASAPVSDERALAGLEAQIATLSRLISQPQASQGGLTPEFESRMSAIEDYIATSDEYIVEAARQAAEAVLDGFMRNGGAPSAAPADLSALNALADDLRHLESLTRNSEERTHRTFEALHDTLVQIAGRLEHMETTRASAPVFEPEPAPKPDPAFAFTGTQRAQETARERAPVFETEEDDFFGVPSTRTEPAGVSAADSFAGPVIRDIPARQQAEPAPVRPPEMPAPQPEKTSLLGGIAKRFMAKSKQSAAAFEAGRTVIDPTPSIAPEDMGGADPSDELLEPGSGVPDVKKILQRVRAVQDKDGEAGEAGRADYITAARRAAQAAARELEPQKGDARKAGRGAKAAPRKGDTGQDGGLARYRRPLLLAVGAVLLVVMSMPLVNTMLNGNRVPPVAVNSSRPAAIEEQARPAEAARVPTREVMPEEPESAAITPPPAPAAATAPAIETVPLAPAGDEARTTAPSALETAAITVPAEVQPPALADAARAGDALALFEIGARYTEGRDGLTSNLAEAAVWYKLSADRGFAPAEYRLANLYEKGSGIPQDFARAMDYYRKAAEQGNASAMHNLAVMYASGANGAPDMEAAAKWFQKAADFGVSDSQFNLAILYARGSGVTRNLEESYRWFAIAAKAGDKDAAQKRDEVANALKPEQLENARAQTELWKPQVPDSEANDAVVPDAWTGKALKTASVDMKKAIRNIQAILNNNGYDAGAPDGEMGPKTVAAIKAFQKSVGQDPSGKITDALVKELLARNK